VYIEIPIVALLAVLSAILLSGRGAFLVAGYNTSSKEQKEKYDGKKLSRTAGVMLSVITVATALFLFGISSVGAAGIMIFEAAFIVVVFVSIAVFMYFMNTKCLKKPPDNGAVVGMEEVAKSPELIRENRRRIAVFVVPIALSLVVVGAVIVSMIVSVQPTAYTVSGGTLTIGTMFGETVPLSGIQKLELKGAMPGSLEKTDGLGLGTILKGRFSASGEEMNVYVDTAHPPFLYLYTANGLVIVNGKNKAETRALYQKLSAAVRR
jgi:hypothetical protein